jgi:hypothetical protein
MVKMKCKVARRPPRPTISAPELAEQSDRRSAGGLTPAHCGSTEERKIIVARIRRFTPWVVAVLAAAPLAPAAGQNLDAGKPASQIFSEVCANCHRSPRDLRSNAGASFLREHYTTGSEMASTMAAYLSSAGTAAGAPQPKRPPAPAAAATTTTTRDPPATREPPAADTAREPRRAAGEPKALPAPSGPSRGRPASAQGTTAEAKPLAAPAPVPARPALEEFEE